MLVAIIGFKASSVIIIVAVFEPFRGDHIYKVANLPVVIPVLHKTKETIDRSKKMLKL